MKKAKKYLLIVLLALGLAIPLEVLSSKGTEDNGQAIKEPASITKTDLGKTGKSNFGNLPAIVFDDEDFGDAPEGQDGYPTTLANNGARHTIVPGIFLGAMVDQEPEGQPSAGADCDDMDCMFPSFGDDEDGVSMPLSVTKGSTVNISVTASTAGFLDAWMDFDLVNGWVGPGEHIMINIPLLAGPNNLSFIVPANATIGQSYIRFRFRDFSNPISFDGLVQNGEVEDYAVLIQGNPNGDVDFGDAPENTSSSYPTILVNNGARHTIVPGIFLGNLVDPEPDGQPGTNANCDDSDCLYVSLGDDEDGVSMPSSATKGSTVNIVVTASIAGFLDAWMDFNLLNSWSEANEHIFINEPLTAGVNTLSFPIPPNAATGQSFIRFRFRDFSGNISFDGLVQNGEVEDYTVLIEDVVQEFDFGDTPDSPFGGFGYPTILSNNGARHVLVSGIYLGSSVDAEPNGQPGVNADCDDTDCLFPSFGDDEDGVVMLSTVTAGSMVNVTVTASVDGFLDAWMDFNLLNGWLDASEHIFMNTPLLAGPNNLSFIVPANATQGQSYIRFRFRDFSNPISFDGLVQNGEVEDYAILIQENPNGDIDFGDAPENTPSSYPTVLANNGARHTIVPGIFLGSLVDPEPDGQPDANATCDDSDCLFPSLGDDEDGVSMPSSVTKGSTVNITVTASIAGFLDAWIDFNQMNSWADVGEHIFINEPLTAGVNILSFTVPGTTATGNSFLRFRFRDFSGVISFDGLVQNGEVEDYPIQIIDAEQEYDFGDAPESPAGDYPTSIGSNGARHVLVLGIYLGDFVDAEPDGQPHASANCDDTDCLFPSFGDDEDGVILPDSVFPGSDVNITVTASVNGYLDAWIDFNRNNDWADAGEHIFSGTPLSAGVNTLTIAVPATADTGQTFVRFRFRDYASPLSFDGLALNGEVEDYMVFISQTELALDIKVILGGCVSSGWLVGDTTIMDTLLNAMGLLPLTQPYNTSPWNYAGIESVSFIPNTDIADWILIELRDASDALSATSETMISRQAAFLLNDGSVVGLDGSSIISFSQSISQSLFVVIYHRNHLGIMSANSLSQIDDIYYYDFTTSNNQAFGTNAQKEIGSGIYGIIAADANSDGEVNTGDKTIWENQAGSQGYKSADFNMDGQVNNPDKNKSWIGNIMSQSQIPE